MGIIFNRPTFMQKQFSVSPRLDEVKPHNTETTHDPNQRFSEFLDVLEAHNIPIFLTCGTALGIVREQRIIPHDFDIDTGFYREDVQRVKAILPQLEEKGFFIRSVSTFNVALEVMGCPKIHIDMYIIERASLFYRLFGKKWFSDHAYFNHDYFNPNNEDLRPYQGKHYRVPAPAETYLKELYGESWRTPLEGVNATYRSVLSQVLNVLIFDSEQPLRFAGLKRNLIYKPWVSKLLKRVLPNAKITHAYRHPN